jgi:hypothetical protein
VAHAWQSRWGVVYLLCLLARALQYRYLNCMRGRDLLQGTKDVARLQKAFGANQIQLLTDRWQTTWCNNRVGLAAAAKHWPAVHAEVCLRLSDGPGSSALWHGWQQLLVQFGQGAHVEAVTGDMTELDLSDDLCATRGAAGWCDRTTLGFPTSLCK